MARTLFELRSLRPAAALGLLLTGAVAECAEPKVRRDAAATVEWLLAAEPGSFPFSNVVYAAAGKRLLPVGNSASDQEFLDRLARVFDAVLEKANRTVAELKGGRINEISSVFENELQRSLQAAPDFDCAFPRNARGQLQRAGYPDLRGEDRKSGRVFYLDPKLYEAGSEQSSFRTFYFEARKETNKILDDAHHLLLGIEHNGKSGAERRFTRWHLVDLSRIHVRLKAEFQTSNQELYQKEGILRSGTAR